MSSSATTKQSRIQKLSDEASTAFKTANLAPNLSEDRAQCNTELSNIKIQQTMGMERTSARCEVTQRLQECEDRMEFGLPNLIYGNSPSMDTLNHQINFWNSKLENFSAPCQTWNIKMAQFFSSETSPVLSEEYTWEVSTEHWSVCQRMRAKLAQERTGIRKDELPTSIVDGGIPDLTVLLEVNTLLDKYAEAITKMNSRSLEFNTLSTGRNNAQDDWRMIPNTVTAVPPKITRQNHSIPDKISRIAGDVQPRWNAYYEPWNAAFFPSSLL
ncbi:MAG: hypothetical protein TREMPRED_001652 [Tremellales sp. Tagirdzhanova-0007]|nr:MAG: hypothetical protein TREMPRED_001652 [Tremellales sp. Tagirdzhanova-0007]